MVNKKRGSKGLQNNDRYRAVEHPVQTTGSKPRNAKASTAGGTSDRVRHPTPQFH
jgi:hypothetical protein